MKPDPYVSRRVRNAYIEVLGMMWLPAVEAAQIIQLSDYDLNNIGDWTRENVDRWLATHSGDFSRVIDFRAVCGDNEIDWKDENNLFTYNGLAFPEDFEEDGEDE